MSLSNLLDIARSGMSASTGGLSITGQNITNATTAGYTKRMASMTTQPGGGVVFNGQVRNFDKFAFSAVVDQSGKQSSAEARATALATIEGVVAPGSNTIGDRATAVMGSFTTLTAYPTDTAVRSDVLAKADDLASTIAATAQGLADASRDLLAKGQDVVGEINDRLSQVASLNDQIASAKAEGSDASDLRDQRDTLIQELGTRVGVKAVEDPQGRMTVFGAGATLVDGDRAAPMALDLDATGKMRLSVTGTSKVDVTSHVAGGSLGGIREARDVDLASSQTKLDAYAFDVANTINAAHASGYGSDGVTGRNLFQISATQAGSALGMKLDPAIKDNPQMVAAAGTAAELPGGNSGAIALAGLSDTNSFGGTTIANRFASMAADVGARKSSADSEKSMRDDSLAIATTASQSVSGVSLDEEMVDMTKFQRAFEAASKVLQTADSLLAGFLNSVGTT